MKNVIHTMIDGKMQRTSSPVRSSPEHANFVITCQYGDWSGFRTLAECEAQFAELERYHRESEGRRWFQVEER